MDNKPAERPAAEHVAFETAAMRSLSHLLAMAPIEKLLAAARGVRRSIARRDKP